MIPLPPPVPGVPFDLETATEGLSWLPVGRGRTVPLLHSFNAAGSGIELAPLAVAAGKAPRSLLVDRLGFGYIVFGRTRQYGWVLYSDQLTASGSPP